MSSVPVPRSDDFRRLFSAATASPLGEERLAKLAELAATDLTYIETIQLDQALAALLALEAAAYTRVRVAVLASATVDHLLPPIRVLGLRRKLLIDVHRGQFGQYRQELMGSGGPLESFAPGIVLLSLDATELIRGVPLLASRDAADRAVESAVAELRELWRAAKERFGATVVQQAFLDTTPAVFGSHERLVPGAPARLIARLNDQLAEAASRDGVLLLDVARASARDGLDAWFDERHWLQGKIEIAPGAAARYAELFTRLLGAHFGRSKKCLVLDLDNTLWGGVVGDDGIEGIVLGEGSALGEAHLALQRYAKLLKERGVILAVCSKNEWSVVQEVFDRHPEMHLRRADIAAFAVNWNDKAVNLRALARQLNIGLDSLVFVDDNPAERARVREALPMVAVPDLPADPAHYVRAIAQGGFLEATTITDEDRARAEQYAANSEREALRGATVSVDEFLRGLEMSVVFGPVAAMDAPRAAQLLNKTNQFNSTTRRLSREELEQWTAAPENVALQFRLIDRFGDNGLVSVLLLRPLAADGAVLEITNWVMSCRVFGRQLEHEAMNIAVEIARERGARALVADYLPTEKNQVIANLFAELGFQEIGTADAAPRASRWRLELAPYEPHATHIVRAGHRHG